MKFWNHEHVELFGGDSAALIAATEELAKLRKENETWSCLTAVGPVGILLVLQCTTWRPLDLCFDVCIYVALSL